MSLTESRLATAAATPTIGMARGQLLALVQLMRIRQWVKNGFVLAALFFSHQLFHRTAVIHSLCATLAFCCASSAMYALNDIFDREADRSHPAKCDRPLARGALQVRDAVLLIAVLAALTVAVVVVAGVGWQVDAVLGAYVAVNVLYSTRLKHLSLVDVAVVASGFVLRLVAGCAAVAVSPSSWIVLCTGLLALVLALGKRRGDLERETAVTRRSLSGYTLGFIDMALGISAAATVVVYAQFTVSDYSQTRFAAPLLYLTTFPVVFGILRYLQLLIVEGRYGSPAEVVFRDLPLQAVLATWIGLFFVFVYA
jgi:decaprenyl-phosphate phosphoribosyltransferase